MRKRRKILDAATQELFSAPAFRRAHEHHRKRSGGAQGEAAVAEAEEKLRNVKRWSRDFDHLADPLVKRLESLRYYLDYELPKGVSFLIRSAKDPRILHYQRPAPAGPPPPSAPSPPTTNHEHPQQRRQSRAGHERPLARLAGNSFQWRDTKGIEFDDQYLEVLPQHVARAASAMEEIESLLKKVRSDCDSKTARVTAHESLQLLESLRATVVDFARREETLGREIASRRYNFQRAHREVLHKAEGKLSARLSAADAITHQKKSGCARSTIRAGSDPTTSTTPIWDDIQLNTPGRAKEKFSKRASAAAFQRQEEPAPRPRGRGRRLR
jgi:hypothetical protein